jgi:hypothetical protein
MYFSDGSAAQYKKTTKIISIHHEQDFGPLLNGTSLQQAIRTDKHME